MSTYLLKICDLGLSLSCPPGVVVEEPDPAYRPFFKPVQGEPMTDIDISLSFGNCDGNSDDVPLFQSGESWQMYQTDPGYGLTFRPPGAERTIWRADMDASFARVRLVYPPDALQQAAAGKGWLYNPLHYPFDQILLMHHLALRAGCIVHAAGLEIEGKGFIFPGRSGAGKSTFSLIAEKDPGLTVLSDDRMIVRGIDGAHRTAGTPWPGEAGHALNRSVSLRGIMFLAHNAQTRIEPISPQRCLEKLLPVVSIPWYHEACVKRMLHFLDGLMARLPAYEIFFRPHDEDLAHVLKDFSRQLGK